MLHVDADAASALLHTQLQRLLPICIPACLLEMRILFASVECAWLEAKRRRKADGGIGGGGGGATRIEETKPQRQRLASHPLQRLTSHHLQRLLSTGHQQ